MADCALVRNAKAYGRRLEQDVQSSFVTNPRCSGVTVVKGWDQEYDGGAGQEYLAAVREEHGDLMLDYVPGSKKSTGGLSFTR